MQSILSRDTPRPHAALGSAHNELIVLRGGMSFQTSAWCTRHGLVHQVTSITCGVVFKYQPRAVLATPTRRRHRLDRRWSTARRRRLWRPASSSAEAASLGRRSRSHPVMVAPLTDRPSGGRRRPTCPTITERLRKFGVVSKIRGFSTGRDSSPDIGDRATLATCAGIRGDDPICPIDEMTLDYLVDGARTNVTCAGRCLRKEQGLFRLDDARIPRTRLRSSSTVDVEQPAVPHVPRTASRCAIRVQVPAALDLCSASASRRRRR